MRYLPQFSLSNGFTGDSKDGARLLALVVIFDAFHAAADGHQDPEIWLRFSDRCQLFCEHLDIDHQELIGTLEARQRTGKSVKRKTKRGKRRNGSTRRRKIS